MGKGTKGFKRMRCVAQAEIIVYDQEGTQVSTQLKRCFPGDIVTISMKSLEDRAVARCFVEAPDEGATANMAAVGDTIADLSAHVDTRFADIETRLETLEGKGNDPLPDTGPIPTRKG